MNLMNNKKRFFVLCVTLLFVVQGCTNQQQRKSNEEIIEVETKNEIDKEKQSTLSLTFEEVKAKYQKLIPVSGGYFITHSKIDSAFYCEFLKERHEEIDSAKLKEVKVVFDSFIMNVLSLREISSKIEKWGLIDSSGNILIPFVCDGIELDKKNFKVTILSNLQNLNTGLVRFVYVGKKFQVSIKDWKWRKGENYHQIILGYLSSDFHKSVINKGPKFYIK